VLFDVGSGVSGWFGSGCGMSPGLGERELDSDMLLQLGSRTVLVLESGVLEEFGLGHDMLRKAGKGQLGYSMLLYPGWTVLSDPGAGVLVQFGLSRTVSRETVDSTIDHGLLGKVAASAPDHPACSISANHSLHLL
jgi:hypothetical protein